MMGFWIEMLERESVTLSVEPASVELAPLFVVVAMVKGELFEAALVSAVRPLGKICMVGFTAGQKPIRPGLLLIKEAVVIGSIWARWAKDNPALHQRHVAEILEFMSTGAIQPRVDRLFPLDDVVQAFELFEQNQGRGNTVVGFKEG